MSKKDTFESAAKDLECDQSEDALDIAFDKLNIEQTEKEDKDDKKSQK